MSTINIGWLKNKNGEKFAPKTLVSQVVTQDGIALENSIEERIEESKTYTDTEINTLSGRLAFVNFEDNESVTNPDILSSDVIIDSMLSENSTNPVQNRTITKEIKTISDDIEYLKRDWEHIETITIEEDDIKIIERTQEPDGTPYNFKKMKIYVYHPVCSNSGRTGFRFVNDDGSVHYAAVGTIENLSKTEYRHSLFSLETINGSLYVDGTVVSSTLQSYETTHVSTCGSSARRSILLNSVTRLYYGSLNGHVLPIGTTMDIYAIRA